VWKVKGDHVVVTLSTPLPPLLLTYFPRSIVREALPHPRSGWGRAVCEE